MKNIQVLKWVSTIILTLAAFVLVVLTPYALYLMFWPANPLTVVGPDVILNPNKTVSAGQALIYRVHYCKNTDKQAALQRSIVGDVVYGLPSSTNNIPAGCRTAINQNIIIPIGVTPGVYHLELRATYQINILRPVSVSSRTEDFTVVTGPSGDPEDAQASSGTATMTTTTFNNATSPTASSAVTVPFGTDPVTQEPTQPTPSPTPRPSLLQRLLKLL